MFENDFFVDVERHCRSRLSDPIRFTETKSDSEIRDAEFCASQLVNVWEKSEDLARRIALLVDLEPSFPIFGRYDEFFDEEDNEADGSHIKPRAFSNLFLSIAQVLTFQPDRTSGHLGLFQSSVELERMLYSALPRPEERSSFWSAESAISFARIRGYRLEDDPILETHKFEVVDLRFSEDALFAAFQEHYIFVRDLDEEYEAFIRLFCRLTLDLAGYCMDFCNAMAALIEGESRGAFGPGEYTCDAEEQMLRIILFSRAIASHGLRVGYASWLETLDTRC